MFIQRMEVVVWINRKNQSESCQHRMARQNGSIASVVDVERLVWGLERLDASHQLRLEALERCRRKSLRKEVCNVDVCPAENDTKQLVLDEITNTKVAHVNVL